MEGKLFKTGLDITLKSFMNSEIKNNLHKDFSFDFTITVVKNDEKNIENTIKSVLSQKKVKVQYIVLDGYSNDNTFLRIKKYKKIKYFKI